MMYWNLMKHGHLCIKRNINAGCGQPYVAVLAKLLHLSLETVVKPVVAVYGRLSPITIVTVSHTVISGMLIKRSLILTLTNLLEKNPVKRLIKSDGTIPYANGLDGLRERLCRFQNPIIIIFLLLNGSSQNTI